MEQSLINLQLEKQNDFWDVESFYDVCLSPSREALGSYRLRENVKPIMELCYLTRDKTGAIFSAIRYWPIKIENFECLLLGPLAVHPVRQGEGHGKYLMGETLQKAEELGWKAVILIGDLSYYGQFNFNISNFIEFPQPTNPNRILIRSLNNFRTDNIRGKARKWGMS